MRTYETSLSSQFLSSCDTKYPEDTVNNPETGREEIARRPNLVEFEHTDHPLSQTTGPAFAKTPAGLP